MIRFIWRFEPCLFTLEPNISGGLKYLAVMEGSRFQYDVILFYIQRLVKNSDPTISAKETFHKRNIPSFLRCRQSFENISRILWGFQNHHFEPTYSCQIWNPTVFDIQCNDINITQGVPPWSDNAPHRIDNFPLKYGSCWSFNGCISESSGLNDLPVIALLPVFLRFVKGWRILFVYQWHSVHSNNINLICCSGFFWVYSFKVISLLIFLHFLRPIFFRHQRKNSGVSSFPDLWNQTVPDGSS